MKRIAKFFASALGLAVTLFFAFAAKASPLNTLDWSLMRLKKAMQFSWGGPGAEYPALIETLTRQGINPIVFLATRVINIALSFLALAFLVLLLYGGWQWMTARGEEDQVEDAKKIITRAVIGLIIVLVSWSVTVFILTWIGGITTVGGEP